MKQMNILTITFLILISLFITNCQESQDKKSEGESTIVYVASDPVTDPTDDTEPTPPPVVPDPPPPTPPAIDSTTDTDSTTDALPPHPVFVKKFIVNNGNGLFFSDGVSLIPFLPVGSYKAGPYNFISENILYILDASGDIDTTSDLDHIPNAALVLNDDFYSCVTMTPEEARAAGALFAPYTTLYKNGFQFGDAWYLNQFDCDKIIASGDSIFLFESTGAYHVISGPASNITHIANDFYIHSRDTQFNLVFFNEGGANIQETYATNFILTAEQWQLFDGLYYSENGFTWSAGTGLREATTTMDDFKEWPYPVVPEIIHGERANLLATGVVDDKIYWIECNRGFLFEFDPGLDSYNQKYSLYVGDGLNMSGSAKMATLKPVIIENILYFSNDGALNKLDLETGNVAVFGVGEVLTWQ